MNLRTYNTFIEIIADLYDWDIEGLKGLLADCDYAKAKKLRKYIKECLRQDRKFEQSIANMWLAEDFAGV